MKQTLLDTAIPLGHVSEYGEGLVQLSSALGLDGEPIEEVPHKTEKEVYDQQLNEISKQLMNLSDYAIQIDDIELAKQIDNDINSLIISQNELNAEAELDGIKDVEAQMNTIDENFKSHRLEFDKLKFAYEESLSRYQSVLPEFQESDNHSTLAQSMQLQLGIPVDVSLPAGMSAVYTFTPQTSDIYKIYTGPYGAGGSSNDTVLELYSDVGLTTLLSSNDDYMTLFSEIRLTLTANTTYYIKLRHYSSVGAVHARLTVQTNQDILTLSSPIDMDLPAGGSQVFKYTPLNSGSYRIYTTYYNSSSSSGTNDTVLHVYSDVNLTTQIAYNDDSNGTLFSQIKMNMTAGKPFYIKLRAYANGPVHARINVVYDSQTFQQMSANVPIDANVGQNQYAAFSFTPTVTGRYRIFTGPVGSTGGINDTMLYLYSNSGMTSSLAYNDDANGTLYSEINYILQEGNTYYIRLTGYAGRSISARIMVRAIHNTYVYASIIALIKELF